MEMLDNIMNLMVSICELLHINKKSIWNYIIKKENCMNMKVDSCILKKESLEILIVKSDTSCMALFYWLKVI